MRVYIAAPYPLRDDDAIGIMHTLEALGHTVTSRWLKSPDELSDEHARNDLEDVRAADMLLAWNPVGWEEKGTGGRHVELGYALGIQDLSNAWYRIIMIGQRASIFHHLDSIIVVDTLDQALTRLAFIDSTQTVATARLTATKKIPLS